MDPPVRRRDMLVDSEYVGDWMASAYLSDGVRIDHALALRPDGGYVWRTRREGRGEHSTRGTWSHDHGEQMLCFAPSEGGPVYGPGDPDLWRVLQLPGMEGANTVMVLRWVAVASRNLPVQFYRVHLHAAAPDPQRP